MAADGVSSASRYGEFYTKGQIHLFSVHARAEVLSAGSETGVGSSETNGSTVARLMHAGHFMISTHF